MFAQEGKGAFAVDRVWAVEVFDFGFVLEALQGVVTIGFSVFVGDPFVGGDAVVVVVVVVVEEGSPLSVLIIECSHH